MNVLAVSRRIRRGAVAVALVCLSAPLFADQVVPSDEVTSRVIVRASASSQSVQVGSLEPGEQAGLVGSLPNWHEVRLGNGTLGFVSKRWTRVISLAPPPVPHPPPVGPVFTMDVVDVGTGLGILLRGPDFTLVYDGGSNDDDARGPSNRMGERDRRRGAATEVTEGGTSLTQSEQRITRRAAGGLFSAPMVIWCPRPLFSPPTAVPPLTRNGFGDSTEKHKSRHFLMARPVWCRRHENGNAVAAG